MERGERKLTKEIVKKLAKIYDHDEEELKVLYLSQKIMAYVTDEEHAVQAMQMAEASVAYQNSNLPNKEAIINKLKVFLANDQRVLAAWIFGSFARGDMNSNSDIDLMVRFDRNQKITFFDLADIVHELEQLTHIKIDLVEEGCLKPFAYKTAQQDLQQIYG
jgi:predicted nucleotidyltransferase